MVTAASGSILSFPLAKLPKVHEVISRIMWKENKQSLYIGKDNIDTVSSELPPFGAV